MKQEMIDKLRQFCLSMSGTCVVVGSSVIVASGALAISAVLSESISSSQRSYIKSGVELGAGALLISASFLTGAVGFCTWQDKLDAEASAKMQKRLDEAKRQHQEALSRCEQCKYFCGTSYGGNYLNCAVHPSGNNENICKDYDVVRE
jgi:hypothetical protein